MATNSDIFGYSKTSKAGGVLSFTDVIIKVGSGSNDLMLCQRVDINYERSITPVMGVGYADIWLAPMPPTGRATVSRAIVLKMGEAGGQSEGLLAPYQQSKSCETQDLIIAPVKNESDCSPSSGTVTCKGLLQSVTVLITTGQGVSVTDGATWTLSDLKIK